MERDEMRALVAIDGSAPAALAIDLVARAAWPDGSLIRVVEAVETGSAVFGGPWPALALVESDAVEAALRGEAEARVEAARQRLAQPGVTVEAAVLRGRPAIAIADEAKAMIADLIVVGSHGHSRIESMLLGSVSAELIDHTPAPVLVARGTAIDRVLLAWDGSIGASRAAEIVRCWPIFGRSAIRVVTVADIGVPWWTGFPEAGSPELMPLYVDAANASREDSDTLARGMTTQLQVAGLHAEAERREGDAASEILAAARESKADLIVIGTHGRTGLRRLVMGSVARSVLQHATVSVLVVRQAP
jgi:nucleotide-binding universal stress UspA family protein